MHKSSVAQSVLSMLFSHLESHINAELIEVAYETALECEVLMKRLRTVCSQSNGARRKNAKDSFFEELGY